jgi:branched-chain amino acid transport system permease protein
VTTLAIYLAIGIVTGAIYAIAATGLVVTYTTSRIFNFAHGALGMFIAYVYYELRLNGMPAGLALALSVLVIGPVIGVGLDRLVMRRLQAQTVAVRLVATIAIYSLVVGVATLIWGSAVRTMPPLFGSGSIQLLSGFSITYDQLATVIAAAAVAVGLWALFRHTRIGVTMRAVVDNPSLAELNGVRPGVITSLAWAIGVSLAGLAAILIAPTTSLSITELSLLVIAAYAAAIFGRLVSTAWTFAGGLLLGISTALLEGYLPPSNSLVQNLTQATPFVLLFIVLLVLGREKIVAPTFTAVSESGTIRLRTAILLSVGAIGVSFAVMPLLHGVSVVVAGTGLIYAAILLSLVLLTGMAGQICLAQFSFVGLGAVLLGHLAPDMPWLLAAVIATVATGAVGALVSLPALRLEGLYLALATLAFALLMDQVVLVNPDVMENYGSGLFIPVPSFFGFQIRTQLSMLPILTAVTCVFALIVYAIKRRPLGRAFAAMRDSPTSASALGLNIVKTKIVVFFLSAAMAGLAGCMYAGFLGGIGPSEFSYEYSLAALLLLAIQGTSSLAGAIVGSAFYAVIYLMLPLWISNPNLVSALQPALIALGVLNLAAHPEGAIEQQKESWRLLRERLGMGAATVQVSVPPTSGAWRPPETERSHSGKPR